MEEERPLTYGGYLRLEELLALQSPRSKEHDELLFIVIHQTYELWFKQMLHEIRGAADALRAGEGWRAMHRLARVRHILKIAVAQVDILETLTPLEFSSFRDRLATSSGFESAQFRELEALLGIRNPRLADLLPAESDRDRVRRVQGEPSLWDVVAAWIASLGHDVPQRVLERNVAETYEGDERLQSTLLSLYRLGGEVTALCESLIDIDEGMQEWRYRHVKMVERTIGRRAGTGGSTGVEYLAASLHRPLFPDLWAIRNRM